MRAEAIGDNDNQRRFDSRLSSSKSKWDRVSSRSTQNERVEGEKPDMGRKRSAAEREVREGHEREEVEEEHKVVEAGDVI